MSKFIIKIGNCITEFFLGQVIKDKQEIKEKVVNEIEGIGIGLSLILINFILSLNPDTIPFKFNYTLCGIVLSFVVLNRVVCAWYYANKIEHK